MYIVDSYGLAVVFCVITMLSAAAISVTRIGAQPSAPRCDEIEAFLSA